MMENMKYHAEEAVRPEISSLTSGNSIGSIGQDKVNSLKRTISEIQKLIQERNILSQNFLREGDEIKLEISNFLLDIENSPAVLGDKDPIIEKNSLRNKKVEISEHQLNEKINCWKDIALLKKELRENEKELAEKEARFIELNNILMEN